MRRALAFATLLSASIATLALSGCGRAEAIESFTLDQHDHLIAEAPGCYSSCVSRGMSRLCTIRESDCKAVCQTIQECKVNGIYPVKVCAVVKNRPY
jgi:hypothetical protein